MASNPFTTGSKSLIYSLILAVFALTACDNKDEKPSKESVEKAQAEMEKKLQESQQEIQTATEANAETNVEANVESVSKIIAPPKASSNAVYKVGLYQYMSNTAVFTECSSGQKFPVASEGDNQSIKDTYLSLVGEQGQPVMIELKGEFLEREGVDGKDAQHLIPSEFIGIIHKTSCE